METPSLLDWLAFRFSPTAMARYAAIDFVDGGDILLHVKPRPDRHAVVLNSYLAGRWGSEQCIPLPPESFQFPLRCATRAREAGLLVIVNEIATADFPVSIERLSRAELRLPPDVEVLGEKGTPHSLAVEGEILVADIAHVRVRLRFLDARQMAATRLDNAALVVRIDGRPTHARPLLPRPGELFTQTTDMCIEFGAEAFVCEGMEVELLLDEPEGLRRLARRPVASRFIGGVEHCSEAMVRGFVINPDLPRRAVMLDVFVGERFEGVACADAPRPDLAAVYPAYANCGFCFRFRRPLPLFAGMEMVVSVRVRDTDIHVLHSPWELSRRIHPKDKEVVQRSARQGLSSGVRRETAPKFG